MKRLTPVLLVFLAMTALLFQALPVAGANFTVNMNNFSYSPVILTIGVGDRVTWTNVTVTGHTSTSGDTNVCSANGTWGSALLGAQGSFSVTFTNFAPGTYTYYCSVHCAVQRMRGAIIITNAPNTPPVVTLTNPAATATFVAPANISVGADASDAGGSITNVQFLVGSNVIGNDITAPYSAVTNGLAAGNYSLSAIASDNNGATATSAVVNVFVLTNATLTTPLMRTDGQFQFTVLGIAGQTYAIEASTNLTNWAAILTNLAPANSFNITDSTSPGILEKHYRTRQDLF